jgi:hypothetical protein
MDYVTIGDIVSVVHDTITEKMASTRWERMFFHTIRIRWYTPPLIIGKSVETDEPFRYARSLGLRFSPARALVLGFWSEKGYDEDTALLEATLLGRRRTDDERHGFDPYRVYGTGDSSDELSGRPGLRDGTTRNAGVDVDGWHIRGTD